MEKKEEIATDLSSAGDDDGLRPTFPPPAADGAAAGTCNRTVGGRRVASSESRLPSARVLPVGVAF